jgi:hypothetical protein
MLISQRPALPHVQHADVWMVVRVETLDWSPTLYAQVLVLLLHGHIGSREAIQGSVMVNADVAGKNSGFTHYRRALSE